MSAEGRCAMMCSAKPIIGIAIVWAAVIIAVALALHGTAQGGLVVAYVASGAAATISIMEAALRRRRASNSEGSTSD